MERNNLEEKLSIRLYIKQKIQTNNLIHLFFPLGGRWGVGGKRERQREVG